MNRRVTALSRAAVLAAALGSLTAAQAADFKVSETLKTLSFGGDVRLRQEMFDKTTQGQVDRSRQRFRVRLATDADLPENLRVRLRFASGTGEQSSTNQSFDNGASQKGIWIDRAYLEWKPRREIRLQAGKQAMPLWVPSTADIVWDGDLNPEGFGQSVEAIMPGNFRLFANALQQAVDEDSGTTADQWEFSGQVGVDALVGDARWKTAAAYHHWTNTRIGSFGQTVAEGNRRITAGPSAGALANKFGVAELTTELTLAVGDTTLTPGGTIIKNLAAMHLQRNGHRHGDMGWQAGARYGKAGAAKTWEAAYYYKWSEVDSTPADFADSDFGDGGTNRQGHVFGASYAPRDWMLLSFRTIATRVINDSEPPGRDHINRYQLDLSVKF